jgi:hypothetical protein
MIGRRVAALAVAGDRLARSEVMSAFGWLGRPAGIGPGGGFRGQQRAGGRVTTQNIPVNGGSP